MKYFIKRFVQPSTWMGVAMAVAALYNGADITPETIGLLFGALGLVHVDEKPSSI